MFALLDPQWVTRFGERLGQLCPSMSATTAAALAIEAYRHHPDGWPETVAERFHADHVEPVSSRNNGLQSAN